MSRSRKKPYIGNWGDSEKRDKQIAHRAERRAVRAALDSDPESAELLHEYDFSDPWNYSKDGKRLWDDPRAERK